MTEEALSRFRADLRAFMEERKIARSKGQLSVVVFVSDQAKERGLPLDPDDLLVERGGQVAGLSGAAVQSILGRFGIERILSKEGGRTSRGSIDNMRAYVAFLNEQLEQHGEVNLEVALEFWVGMVKEYFAKKPFLLNVDPALGMRAVVRDLLNQAQERQAEAPGSTFVGTVLQHLVGAKLEVILGADQVQHHPASAKDDGRGRGGDFDIEDTIIHVTSAPSEALLSKCAKGLQAGFRPLVVTTAKQVGVAEGLADQRGILDRLDVVDIEQLIATNIYERSLFSAARRRVTAEELVTVYNRIISDQETDPSLKISIR